MNKIIISCLFAAILLIALAACQKDSKTEPGSEKKSQAQTTPQMLTRDQRARVDISRMKLAQIKEAVDEFWYRYGRLPQGLADLYSCTATTGQNCTPLMQQEDLNDAWGNPLQYAVTGQSAFRLKSLGANGHPGGADADLELTEP